MKARLWATGLSLLFGAVLVWYLYYTQQLVSAANADAAALTRIYARTYQSLSDPTRETSVAVLFDMLDEIEQLGIPVVLVDADGQPSAALNLPFVADLNDPADQRRVLAYAEMLDRRNAPIAEAGIGEIHFGAPSVVERLRWVPFIQAATLIVIVLAAVWIFRSTVRAEQERVWATMARESAHQLSTPLSSLAGWVEILRMPYRERSDVADDEKVAREIEVDVERLNKVAQRFELIGRRPRVQTVDIGDVLRRLADYFSLRLPRMERSIKLDVQIAPELPPVAGNPVLLEWAFENIIKNAVDVLAGRGGRIQVSAESAEAGRSVRIRFLDDGPGVPHELRKKIFEPGTSRKAGGWGVGLSLARRIVEDTHGGSIQLGRPRAGAEFIVGLPVMSPERVA
ncbi:MAG: HAMP domain-containing histidine kinase [Gemmatimonadota bacterium]|nr:MAG: HAMP domain-containing histidine kinase [Gemmatimonadota bacterium]